MDNAKLKVKVGEHEFEAEGPSDIVQAQFETFKKLIDGGPKQETARKQEAPAATKPSQESELMLDRICKVAGRVVSLTVKPELVTDAAMLVMLCQRQFREIEAVTASEIKDGLEQSGYRIDRLDRIMQPLADDGSLVRIGARKGTRYRFTNPGFAKSQEIAREVIAKFV
jgi:hypothetical protein